MANRSLPSRRALVVRPGPSRASIWFEFVPVRVPLSSAGGTLIFSLNTAALALRPFTVIRSRFQLFIDSDQSAVDEVQVAGFGIAVVSDQAVAIGVTAVPTPITNLGSDLWFVHQLCYGATTHSDSVGSGSTIGVNIPVDSKAMRKVAIGQDIVVMGEFSAVGAGSRLTVGGRMLVKSL